MAGRQNRWTVRLRAALHPPRGFLAVLDRAACLWGDGLHPLLGPLARRAPRPKAVPAQRYALEPRPARRLGRQSDAEDLSSLVRLDLRATDSPTRAGEVKLGQVHAEWDDVQGDRAVGNQAAARVVDATRACSICCCSTDSPSDYSAGET